MPRTKINARSAGFSLFAGMAAALIAGCTGQSSLASAPAPKADSPVDGLGGDALADKALAKAEARVAKAPNNAAARAELAQAYLGAGRFDSAATTFEDAVALGEKSPRTGLSLALAYIGSGRGDRALAVLSQWQGRIPAGDFGLAVALAGQPAQGVSLLTDTLRGGENTAKVRQNLAYAYALDGRWSEARIIAGQDVPGDQLNARMQDWAARARPDQAQARVAGLLGTPMRADPGQPAALALGSADHAPRMAVAEVPAVPAPEAELPATQPDEASWGAAQPQEVAYEAPVPVAAPAPAPAKPPRNSIERAFTGIAKADQPRVRPTSHVVQLGSFVSRDGAKRAWAIFQKRNPALRDHTLRITEADVNGRHYFRVAAVGFDRGSAQAMCLNVKQKGGACLAMADGQQKPSLPGAGALMARNR